MRYITLVGTTCTINSQKGRPGNITITATTNTGITFQAAEEMFHRYWKKI